ncbi:unnamed protein product [Onchocerca flexuosa]|uniref:VHS domain-containing protein n=1 Tax=Onchocerca flexuosa TaxID=387005 RepID=A0A183H6F0_9BILA|nr:unnamed protein product [Onchocerca flexuosa]
MHDCEHIDRVLQLQICFVLNRMNATGIEWLKDIKEKQEISFDPHVLICITIEMCSYCKALKFNGETKGMCCVGEKIKLPQLGEPPQPLKALLAGYTPNQSVSYPKSGNTTCAAK